MLTIMLDYVLISSSWDLGFRINVGLLESGVAFLLSLTYLDFFFNPIHRTKPTQKSNNRTWVMWSKNLGLSFQLVGWAGLSVWTPNRTLPTLCVSIYSTTYTHSQIMSSLLVLFSTTFIKLIFWCTSLRDMNIFQRSNELNQN